MKQTADREDLMEHSGTRAPPRHRFGLIAVTLTCVVCITLLSSLQLYLNSKTDVLIERKKLKLVDGELEEKFEDNGQRKLSVYDFKSFTGDHNVTVVLDASRGLEVTKISTNESAECFVSIIAFGDEQSRIRRGKPLSELRQRSMSDGEVHKSIEMVQISGLPIHDKSFLGDKGMELCKDANTYWSLSSLCGESGSTKHFGSSIKSRQKRQSMTPKAGPGYWCYLDPDTCGYFNYPGQTRLYYRCDRKCVPYNTTPKTTG